MNSSARLLRAHPVPASPCQLCGHILRQPKWQQRRPLSSASAAAAASHSRGSLQRTRQQSRKIPASRASQPLTSRLAFRTVSTGDGTKPLPSANATNEVGKARDAILAIIHSESVPSEDALLDALKVAQKAAEYLSGRNRTGSEESPTPTSVLLDQEPHTTDPSKRIETLSTLLYRLMQHPPVFMSPKVLDAYITTQSILEQPESFPEILHLYANKPVAQPDTSPVKFNKPNPNNPAAAVPSDVANRALDAAIQSKDLHLALSIIELTFRQPAYRRAMILRKVMPPVAGLALAPGAAYVLASKFADYQQVVNPQSAMQMAMIGIMAYVGAVSTIGVVAVTTANDQMDRITWATGMALSERYLREEERAAVDRVAQAWGFKDPNRKGEEEGEEWDELREWVGLRGMVLDKVELMEGME
ncbi:hypothetical protein MPH_11577 [Macrophomina phaseolina MS6]|uniref:Uncharacterized protein n=1 Tax=Macrophomina phaseolina (strain MS6) TaxID=1126212 RepID=K2REH3_MACPH|nr:hypothetical protein MPH_11577 [Macrophomina phaseolina MS6]